MSERRLEIESVLRCPGCDGIPYRIYRRQNQQKDGTLLQSFQSVLWPAPGATVDPPIHPEHICCPRCGEALTRVAP